MKAINLLKGLAMALIAALLITVLPVQTSLFAKDDSATITNTGKHKDGKHHRHHKHHKHHKKTSTNNKTKDNKDTKTNNNTNQKDTKTNKK